MRHREQGAHRGGGRGSGHAARNEMPPHRRVRVLRGGAIGAIGIGGGDGGGGRDSSGDGSGGGGGGGDGGDRSGGQLEPRGMRRRAVGHRRGVGYCCGVVDRDRCGGGGSDERWHGGGGGIISTCEWRRQLVEVGLASFLRR